MPKFNDWKEGTEVDDTNVDIAWKLKHDIDIAYKNNNDKQTEWEPINEFLLKVRKVYW